LQGEIRAKTIALGDVAVFKAMRREGSTRISLVDFDPDGDVYELWEKEISR
jgi:hypothetical protein